jgi:hypothetical protein
VSIGRHGDLLFSEGHRLAIAVSLGIKRMVIRIPVRHPEWMSLREVACYMRKMGWKNPSTTYPYWSRLHNSLPRGRRQIKENMPTKQGHLLEIGGNSGYFCHRFENEGSHFYGIVDTQETTDLFTDCMDVEAGSRIRVVNCDGVYSKTVHFMLSGIKSPSVNLKIRTKPTLLKGSAAQKAMR